MIYPRPSIRTYIGKGTTEVESVKNFVRQVGRRIKIDMGSKTVFYNGERHHLISIMVDNKDYIWDSFVL